MLYRVIFILVLLLASVSVVYGNMCQDAEWAAFHAGGSCNTEAEWIEGWYAARGSSAGSQSPAPSGDTLDDFNIERSASTSQLLITRVDGSAPRVEVHGSRRSEFDDAINGRVFTLELAGSTLKVFYRVGQTRAHTEGAQNGLVKVSFRAD